MEGLPIKSQTEGIMFHVSPLLFSVQFFFFFFVFSTWRGLCLDFAAFYPVLPCFMFCLDRRGKVFNVTLFKQLTFNLLWASTCPQ